MTTRPLNAGRLRGAAITTLLVAGFAAGWGVSGSVALPDVARNVALLLVLAITIGWLGLAYRFFRAAPSLPDTPDGGANPFRTRDYQLAVLAECIAIPLAGRLLTAAGRPDAIMPAVAAIVGLHFFGLIRAFQSWRFAVVGGAMVLLALLSLAIPPLVSIGPGDAQLGARAAVVGFGCALLLWGGIVSVVAGTWRQLSYGAG